ncbi:MAG: restriction endonuclease subunit S [Candidatus Cloacimonadaceae bacterium]
MEIKPGYKRTEIGVIPEDWEVLQLGTLTRSVASGKSKNKKATGAFAFYGSTGIIGHSNDFDYVGARILVARVGANAGSLYRVDGRYSVSDNTLIVDVLYPEDLIYLSYYLEYINLNRIVFGSGQPLVTGSQIKKILIPKPQKLETKMITEALSDIKHLIRSLEKLIEKKKLIMQGVMQELLTGKKRLSGFTGEWETKIIGACFSILRGSGLSKSQLHSTGQYKCILYGELFTTYTDIIDKVHSATNVCEGVESISGDILLPGSTTTTGIDLAKSSALKIGGVLLGGDINILRPIEKLDSAFISLYINVNKRYSIATKTKGTTIHHLHANDLRDIIIEMPSLEEQIAISMLIMELDKEIAFLEKRLSKYRSIKQAMMQELLTGRIRLL